MARRGIFDFDSLSPALQELLPRVDAAVDFVFDRYEAEFETKMRQGASWTDRTGNARSGLFAQHDKEPMVQHTLTLYGAMPYSIWLEVRWSGKYAIIGPTMLDLAPQMAADIAAAVNRAIRSI
jgi:hypothetical protein